MNEEQFRTRLRGAIGEPPSSDLRRQVEARLAAATIAIPRLVFMTLPLLFIVVFG